MNIIKRNGDVEPFDKGKIISAITKANKAVSDQIYSELSENGWPEDVIPQEVRRRIISARKIEAIAGDIEEVLEDWLEDPTVEAVQNLVIDSLLDTSKAVGRAYSDYAHNHALRRAERESNLKVLANIESIVESSNPEIKEENANKNATIASTQRDYMAGETSKMLSEQLLLPEDVVKAHKEGIIHFHDMDYFAQHIHNCDLVNLEDMLQNGTVISNVLIEKPHSFYTACNITTQIIAQVASSQHGGQSFSLSHLAPFVEVSRKKLRKDVREELLSLGDIAVTDEQINSIAENRLMDEIKRGIQTIQYQLITLMTTNGQAPFVTMFMYIDEVPEGKLRDDLILCIKEVLRQRYEGVKNEQGVWITPAFPKLIYVLDEDNITEGSKYFEVTKLAAKCTAKRMVPDYISAKVMKEQKLGNVYTCMGCRSFLTAEPEIKNPDGSMKFYGRFNQGVVTLNLPDVACASYGDMNRFWVILEERLELCHKALRARHDRLKGTLSDVAPILWQYGALARLKKGEPIDKLLYGGYSTISLGYSGLYETCMRMTGKSHTDPEAKPFALSVMQALNDACAKWREAENIGYSVYGTPMESTTYKFAKATRKRYGDIPDVTDHDYQTNSYHVVVREQIDAFTKLSFESEFQKLSPGGAISYVEVPNLQDNLDAVLAVMKHIYENIMYAELNTKSDYCQECGYDGQIDMVKINGRYTWKCPNCGNTNHDTMNIARRVCGYIGTNDFNQGRMGDVHDRVLHL